MVKPNAFLIVELSSTFRTSRNIKGLYKFVEGKEFLFRSRIPTQESKEVYNRFGEVSAFSIARTYLRQF